MSKILITADLHFGVTGKTKDIIWACQNLRQYAQEQNIHTVLVLGDMFHDRKTLDIDVLTESYRFFDDTKHKFNQTWITFPGNHDMYLRHSWDVCSPLILDKLITYIDTVKHLQINDQRFAIVPFITYEHAYINVLRATERKSSEDDILLTHIGTTSAILNSCFLLKEWSEINLNKTKFKRCYTGHFHCYQQVGAKTWYPGSLIPFKFDEGSVPHGFIELDLETMEQTFVDVFEYGRMKGQTNLPPQFMTITVEQIENMSLDEIKGNNIKVIMDKEMSSSEKEEVKVLLERQGAHNVKWMDMVEKFETPQQIANASLDRQDVFRSWLELDSKNAEGLDKSILLQLNKDITSEGDREYAIESKTASDD